MRPSVAAEQKEGATGQGQQAGPVRARGAPDPGTVSSTWKVPSSSQTTSRGGPGSSHHTSAGRARAAEGDTGHTISQIPWCSQEDRVHILGKHTVREATGLLKNKCFILSKKLMENSPARPPPLQRPTGHRGGRQAAAASPGRGGSPRADELALISRAPRPGLCPPQSLEFL